MPPVRLDPTLKAGFAGATADAAMPARFGSSPLQDAARESKPRRSVLGIALRMVRDAAIAIVLMAFVPIAFVAGRGSTILRTATFSEYVNASIVRLDVWRPFALPKDPSITAEQAGLAYAELQPQKSSDGFNARAPSADAVKTWRDEALRPDMFVDATPAGSHVPNAKTILQAARKGFAPTELTFLRRLASAPIWRDFDLVARAPAVDILGGQFILPFGPQAYPAFRNSAVGDIREMANAAVSRAAYHMSIGQKDSAETILRSIVSVGFALADNGTSAMDEMIGAQIVDIGREGLRQYYEIQGDPRAATLTPPQRRNGQRDAERDPDAFRAVRVARLGNPTSHRGERFESLNFLAVSSCMNVRELIMGPRADVQAALDKARVDLPRYASERALVNLLEQTKTPQLPKDYVNPISDLAVSAASVAGAAFHNPRFAQCTRLLTIW